MQNKTKLFFKIFFSTSILFFLSLWTAAAIDEGMVESKVVNVLGTFVFNIFRFPFLFTERIVTERYLQYYWFLIEFFLDILFYTIIIYYIYLWYKNRKKAKEE